MVLCSTMTPKTISEFFQYVPCQLIHHKIAVTKFTVRLSDCLETGALFILIDRQYFVIYFDSIDASYRAPVAEKKRGGGDSRAIYLHQSSCSTCNITPGCGSNQGLAHSAEAFPTTTHCSLVPTKRVTRSDWQPKSHQRQSCPRWHHHSIGK